MTKTTVALYAIGSFILGALVALGGAHVIWKHQDARDSMQTIASFQDWRMSCPPRTTKKAVCVLQTAIVQKGTSNVLVELSVVPKGDTDMLSIVTPLGVLVQSGVALAVGSGAGKPILFKTCIQVGCVAAVPIDASMASALSQNTGGQITVVAGNGKAVALSYSLRGYQDALAARAVDTAARK
jgi:invasion protein IalB